MKNGQLWDVAFSPDGSLVAASGDYGKVEIWDSQTGQKTKEFAGHEDIVFVFAFSPDGRQLATANRNGFVKIWDISSEGAPEIATLTGHNSGVIRLAYSLDGNWDNPVIIVTFSNKVCRPWPVRSSCTRRAITTPRSLIVRPQKQHEALQQVRQAQQTAAAINLARLDAWFTGRKRAQTRISRFATLRLFPT